MPDIILLCTLCKKKIVRSPCAVNPGNNFCNHHCAAIFTNSHRISQTTLDRYLREKQSKNCHYSKCINHIGIENQLFCSNKCRSSSFQNELAKFKEDITKTIKTFVEKNGRVPFKRELPNEYRRIRVVFGTWNDMIKAAGFEPNPVLFSKKYIANDGHHCDSLSEKIIDDWLYARKIPHEVKVKYPWNNGMSADFKVGEFWIELFGLTGQLRSYDRLMKMKLEKAKKYKLNLISLYLSDLFPQNRLKEKLSILQI